ncbi:MAG: helix-turn-helix transcriptional regulator [Planctomycetia bacterium]|nr:helix-turn-helix transcriptional regulator [Planctomycetia bacterium]
MGDPVQKYKPSRQYKEELTEDMRQALKRIAKQVKAIRKKRRLGWISMGRMCNVNPSSISKLQSGSRVPKLGLLIKICRGLGVSLDYLVWGESAQPPQNIREEKLLESFRRINVNDQETVMRLTQFMAERHTLQEPLKPSNKQSQKPRKLKKLPPEPPPPPPERLAHLFKNRDSEDSATPDAVGIGTPHPFSSWPI